MLPFDPPENIRKFLFLRGSKGSIGENRVKQSLRVIFIDIERMANNLGLSTESFFLWF